jgi:hypothetical protein
MRRARLSGKLEGVDSMFPVDRVLRYPNGVQYHVYSDIMGIHWKNMNTGQVFCSKDVPEIKIYPFGPRGWFSDEMRRYTVCEHDSIGRH